MLPVHLFNKIALQDQSGRVHWLLVTSVKSYARFMRENKGVFDMTAQRFIKTHDDEVDMFVSYLPNNLLHGPTYYVRDQWRENMFGIYYFGRLIDECVLSEFERMHSCTKYCFCTSSHAGNNTLVYYDAVNFAHEQHILAKWIINKHRKQLKK